MSPNAEVALSAAKLKKRIGWLMAWRMVVRAKCPTYLYVRAQQLLVIDKEKNYGIET